MSPIGVGASVPGAGYEALRPSLARGHAGVVNETEPKGAWPKLIVALVLSTIGGSGFWSVVVALPAIGSAFAVNRADASLAYTATMLGYAGGTLVMARLTDRFGITLPLAAGTVMLGLGYVAVGNVRAERRLSSEQR